VNQNHAIDYAADRIASHDVGLEMAEAVAERASGLRFDICIGKGEPTTDLSALLVAARWPWQ
jgi:hypothetical protein